MNDVAETPSPSTLAGARLVQFNLIATAVFTASALLAAIVFDSATRIQGVVVSLTLFAVGVWVFLWSYWSAVQRSRIDSIAVAQLYFLTGDVVPRFQKRAMSLALTVQVVVSLATALARPNTDGDPGSTLAFGILVPMLGLGLNGLLAARHGRFTPRREATSHSESPTSTDSDAEIPPVDPEMEQNASHG
jgi:hypothetical protein